MAALRNGRFPVSESELLSNALKSVDHYLSLVVTGTRPGLRPGFISGGE